MIATLIAVFVSCDGALIASDAPAVWRQDASGWEQLHGAPADVPEAADVRRASCAQAPVSNTPLLPRGAKRTGGSSRDRSLLWSELTDASGTRFTVRLWTGDRYDTVIDRSTPR